MLCDRRTHAAKDGLKTRAAQRWIGGVEMGAMTILLQPLTSTAVHAADGDADDGQQHQRVERPERRGAHVGHRTAVEGAHLLGSKPPRDYRGRQHPARPEGGQPDEVAEYGVSGASGPG